MTKRYDLDGFPEYPILAFKVIFPISAISNPTMLAMKIVINGEERSVGDGLTLAALVEQLSVKADRVAIELNRSIVRRDDWPQTALHDGDRLEVVHFVGGGVAPFGAREGYGMAETESLTRHREVPGIVAQRRLSLARHEVPGVRADKASKSP